MSEFTDRARAEAEGRWPERATNEMHAVGYTAFLAGVEWARTCTPSEEAAVAYEVVAESYEQKLDRARALEDRQPGIVGTLEVVIADLRWNARKNREGRV